MSQVMKLQGNRMEFLDALRGIAASVVVIQHTLEAVSPRFHAWSGTVFNLGQFGVVIFFLISGFIIPVTLERSKSLKIFWVNRACRLYPVYWVSLVLILALYLLGRPGLLEPAFVQHFLKSVAVNVTMLQLFVGVPNAIPSYWTLGMELAFYLAISILFAIKLLSRPIACAWLAALGMLAVVLGTGFVLHRSVAAGRSGLLVTAFFGTAIFGLSTLRVKAKELLILAPIVAVTLTLGFWFRFHTYPRLEGEILSFEAVMLSWGAAYVVFLGVYGLRGHEFPRWLLWLGQISYSLYLTQGLVLAALPWVVNPYLSAIVNILGSLGLAAIVNVLIEKPATAYLKAKTKSLFPKPRAEAVAS